VNCRIKKTQVFLDSKILLPRDQQQAACESRQALTGDVTVITFYFAVQKL